MRFNGRIFLLLIVFLSSQLYSQETKLDTLITGWNKIALGKLNFTQTSFSNWSQGGENSWAWLFNFSSAFVYQQDKYIWTSTGKFEYGKSKLGDNNAKKSADEIFLSSEYAYNLKKPINLFMSASGRTQFNSGYDYNTEPATPISKFLNPVYFVESTGLKFTPTDFFDTRIGVGFKQTIVTDEQFAPRYTDKSDTDKLDKIRSEVGLESFTNLKRKITDTAAFTSSLEIFSDMKVFNEIDVRWDNLLTAEVTKYIAFSFNFQLFYDMDISSKRQIKQYLGIGLTYTLL